MIPELNERSREIFRFIVDSYLQTGSPVGSRTVSRQSALGLSPASIRNTMADLEDTGLLHAPHTSAGRIPTEQGLRLYIDGLMQIGGLSAEERKSIEATCKNAGQTFDQVLRQTSNMLSGLSSCASLVIAPKMSEEVRQIQFVKLQPGKILVIMVMKNGLVENRIMPTETDIPESALISAANYINAQLRGKSIEQTQQAIREDIAANRTQLDAITQNLVEKGLALEPENQGHIIIRGQSRLLEDVKAMEDLERARTLLSYLEEQKNMLGLLESVSEAEGVQIFIGTENRIFDQSGWSMILSPYKGQDEKIVGAIGVIGPMRLDYDRIIPMVDYTSRIVSRVMEDG